MSERYLEVKPTETHKDVRSIGGNRYHQYYFYQ